MSTRLFPVAPLAFVLALGSGSAGCAATHYASARTAGYSAAAPPTPLDRSLFARDPQGTLSEEALQQILVSPLELDLPARVGVLPILTVEDWRGPGPDYRRVPAGVGAFVAALRGADMFSIVTEVLPIPSGALGMEALRQVAARYALRYIVLYRESIGRDTRVNGWASLYATALGALFVPGQTLEVSGYLEASLFDVKTGLLLFTVRRSVRAEDSANLWHNGHKLDELERMVTTRFAPKLGEDLRTDTIRFADAIKLEKTRHLASVSP